MIRYVYSGRDLGTAINVRGWNVVVTVARRLFR